MRLASLAWTDLQSVARDRVAVVPLAAFEQHGPHLPFATDAVILESLLDAVAQHVAECVLLLPIQWLADSGRHSAYGGTLTVHASTHVEMIAAIVDSIVGAGFARILLLNGQYDGDASVSMALRTIRERRPGLAVLGASYWSLADLHETMRPADHGGRMETALMIHLRPEMVRTDALAADRARSSSPFADRVLEYLRMDQVSHAGSVGDPRKATAKEGHDAFDRIVTGISGLIQDFHDGIIGR
jgi:creatinine amidohydrolase